LAAGLAMAFIVVGAPFQKRLRPVSVAAGAIAPRPGRCNRRSGVRQQVER
jgi:hypothetical protein